VLTTNIKIKIISSLGNAYKTVIIETVLIIFFKGY
jgi:hypothetical protein